MNNIFYADNSLNLEFTTSQLISDINNTTHFCNICQSDNAYVIFQNVIVSLLIDEPIILIDSDISIDEKNHLIGDIQANNIDLRGKMKVASSELLLEELIKPKENWSITLFTSGTTGLPKKISHSFESITRKVRKQSVDTQVWGFAYNPTHMAGLQVFFNALLNSHTIVQLFGKRKSEIIESIEKYSITHISATPTFYRLLLPIEKQYLSVVRITSGGEKFDVGTIEKLNTAFPNAKITNIYASTEAGSLLASNSNIFTIKKETENLFDIKDGELLIHKSLLGDSEVLISDGEWYHTKDLVEVVSTNPTQFKFVARQSEMINIGGYKVNPNEVEEVLRTYPDIKEVLVYSKENRILGNIICCDIVIKNQIIESELRQYLSSKLQEFKVPRIINIVDAIETTKTGKISRKK